MSTAAPSRSVCLVSLGCAKNLVDSEVMVGHLGRSGIELVTEPADADVVIVNTCGFIDAAREESVDTILQYTAMKDAGQLRGVVVAGCLVELHAEQLSQEIPEVDAFLGLSDYSGVPSIVDQVLGIETTGPCAGAVGGGAVLTGGGDKGGDADLGRALLTPTHTAYLRLGEGCNHVCAFCAIPKIRGTLRSKPLDVLVEEAAALAELGARELTLVAEDSTDYGKDLDEGHGLADLLERLGAVDGLRWIRVMYAHPATIDDRLIETMARVPAVAPYLDMPVQHGDAGVLRAMRRGTSPERIRQVVAKLRAEIPELTLRTTILTGFPGETEEAFQSLLDLLDELAFDRVGCFVFSDEETTEAHRLPGHVPRDVAEARREQVMARQRERLQRAHKARVGSEDELLIDAVVPRPDGPGRFAIGRTVRDAPEVDGQVLVALPAEGAPDFVAGRFARVRITGVQGYDLLGAPLA